MYIAANCKKDFCNNSAFVFFMITLYITFTQFSRIRKGAAFDGIPA